jgi:hypothetical protein
VRSRDFGHLFVRRSRFWCPKWPIWPHGETDRRVVLARQPKIFLLWWTAARLGNSHLIDFLQRLAVEAEHYNGIVGRIAQPFHFIVGERNA